MRNKFKIYSVFLVLITLFSALGLILIIRYLDPYQSAFNIVIFYLSLLALVLSFTALAGFQVRQVLGQREHAGKDLRLSLRQAVWLSILIAGSLMLQSFGLFNFLNAIILILAFIFLESYFLYSNQND